MAIRNGSRFTRNRAPQQEIDAIAYRNLSTLNVVHTHRSYGRAINGAPMSRTTADWTFYNPGGN